MGTSSPDGTQWMRQLERQSARGLLSAAIAFFAGLASGILFFLQRSLAQNEILFAVGVGLTVAQVIAAFLAWHAIRGLANGLSDVQVRIASLAQVDRQESETRAELERRSAEQARLSELVETLSTPLIPLSRDVIVVPLVGTIDGSRVRHLRTNLLLGIERHRARVAIIDLTGVAQIDDEAVETFTQAISGVELMGCRVVLTGISTQMARSLLDRGIDLHAETYRDLQAGIAYATAQIHNPVIE